jgi:hypothetical protein
MGTEHVKQERWIWDYVDGGIRRDIEWTQEARGGVLDVRRVVARWIKGLALSKDKG